MAYILKERDASLDYVFDFSADLASDSGTISTFTVTKTGSATYPRTATKSTNKVTVWLAGGTVGEVVTLTVSIVTSNARTFSATKPIRIA